MSYYFSRKLSCDFESAVLQVTEKLKEKGFGVLTEIDVQATLKEKLDINFYKYKILGACNPTYAYRALEIENKVGLMLPCNIIVQQISENDLTEVSAVDPIQSMASIESDKLYPVAREVRDLLQQVIKSLH